MRLRTIETSAVGQAPDRRVKKAYSVQEVADLTSLSKPYLRNMIRSGDLKVKRFGRRVVILAEALDEFLQNDEQN